MKHRIYVGGYSGEYYVEEDEQFIVEVKGNLMLREIPNGLYRIKIVTFEGFEEPVAVFFKPKGRTAITWHFLDDLMFMTEYYHKKDGTVILKKYEGKL